MRGLVRRLGAIALCAALAGPPAPAAAAAAPPFMWLPLEDGAPVSYYVNDAWTARNGLPTYELTLPTGGLYKHLGTDYPMPAGAPVYAAARGTVTFSQDGFGDGCAKNTADNWGNAVWIRHDNAYTTMYAHMQRGSVAARLGQTVEAGQLIGRIGNSGNTFGGACGGYHLHLEVRDAGFVVVNPYDRDSGYLWTADPPRRAVGTVPPPALPCGTTGTPASTVYLPNVTKTLGGPDGWVTPFYVQNTATLGTATVETSFYRFSDGALVACRKVVGLQPGATYGDDPNADGDLPGGTQFSVVVRSWGATVVAVVDQLRGSGAATLAASYAGFTSGATSVYLPNVTRRFFGYDVPFIIQSLGTVNARVSAHFVSFDGTKVFDTAVTIAPGRSAVIDPDATPGLADGTQYAVSLTSDQPIGVVANAYNVTGASVAYTHTGLATGATVVHAPYAVKTATAASPVVVQNLGGAPADATLTFTPLGGGTSQTFTLTAISARGSRAFDPRFMLGTTAPCTAAGPACLGQGEYSVRVSSAAPLAAVVLPTGPLTAAAYAATAAPAVRAFVPLVRRSVGGPGGWTTALYVQSVGAQSARVTWYRLGDGAAVTTQTLTLPVDGALRLDPRTVAGLADDARYSVVIRADSGSVTAIAYDVGPEGDAVMIAEAFPGP